MKIHWKDEQVTFTLAEYQRLRDLILKLDAFRQHHEPHHDELSPWVEEHAEWSEVCDVLSEFWEAERQSYRIGVTVEVDANDLEDAKSVVSAALARGRETPEQRGFTGIWIEKAEKWP